jgi:hypothetical protein
MKIGGFLFMRKKVTLKKIKKLQVESFLDKNEFKCWRYKSIPKELVPTEADIGKLVKIAREPGTRDYLIGYRIRGIKKDPAGAIIELIGEHGYASYHIDSVILSNDKLTKHEKLIIEHNNK